MDTNTTAYFSKIRENLSDAVMKTYNFLKYPAIYTAAFDALSGTMEAVKCAATEDVSQSLDRGIHTMEHNILMFSITNLIYGRGVDYLTRKFGKFGAYGLFAATNIIQYSYLLATQDTDPTFQCAITATVAAYLTNLQIKEIEKEKG